MSSLVTALLVCKSHTLTLAPMGQGKSTINKDTA